MLQSSVSCDMPVLCFKFLFYVIITNTMAYWYDGAALAATRSPVIALFWCLIKFTTTTTTTPQCSAPCLFVLSSGTLSGPHVGRGLVIQVIDLLDLN